MKSFNLETEYEFSTNKKVIAGIVITLFLALLFPYTIGSLLTVSAITLFFAKPRNWLEEKTGWNLSFSGFKWLLTIPLFLGLILVPSSADTNTNSGSANDNVQVQDGQVIVEETSNNAGNQNTTDSGAENTNVAVDQPNDTPNATTTSEDKNAEREENTSPQKRKYIGELAGVYAQIGVASSNLERLMGGDNPVYGWSRDERIEVAGSLATFKTQADQFEEVEPPVGWKSFHQDFQAMLDDYSRMADLMADGIDKLDGDIMMQGVRVQKEATRELSDLTDRFKDKIDKPISELSG